MRRRNIKSVLRNKLEDWAKSIDDHAVKALVLRDSVISGGSIASMLMGESVNDFDIYFSTKETTLAVAKYYVEKFKQNPPPKFAGQEKLVRIQARDFGDRVKIVVKSQGIAGESESDSYQYFEQIDDGGAAAEQFVDAVMNDAVETEEADKAKDKPKYRPKFLTSNAITLSNRVQVVIRFFGKPSEIHANYDFIHCMCAWEADSGNLTIPQEAVESMLAN